MWAQAMDEQLTLAQWYRTERGKLWLEDWFTSFYHLKEKDYRGLSTSPVGEAETHSLTSLIWRADTCFITEDMQEVVSVAQNTLPEVIYLHEQEVLTHHGFLYLEEPVWVEARPLKGRQQDFFPAKAFAWQIVPPDREDGLFITRWDNRDDGRKGFLGEYVNPVEGESQLLFYLFADSSVAPGKGGESLREVKREFGAFTDLDLIHYMLLPLSSRYPIIENHDALPGDPDTILKFFIAFHLIAQQRIVTTSKEIPPRATRKRAKRANWDVDQTRYVTLITLRHKKKVTDEHHEVEWAHRWVVEGHWRRQWYPSLKKHQWVYIHEYIKGPENKPLRIREKRVFNLAR